PLGTFKRQKCLRFKNRSGRQSAVSNPSPSSGGRCGPGGPGSSASAGAVGGNQLDDDRRPILRSKSDISDRYWNRSQPERSLPVAADVRDHRERRVDRERDRDRDRDRDREQLEKQRSRSDSLTQLERFFDRLGLDEETYDRYIAPKSALQRRSSGSYHHHAHHNNSASSDIHRLSDDCSAGGGSGDGGGGGAGGAESDESSAVFFSDVSTIDSTKLPDSTETTNGQIGASGAQLLGGTGPTVGAAAAAAVSGGGQGALVGVGDGAPLLGGGPAPLYRTSEPPSIIERNARIIKWLCNCKKMQLA
uniref:Centrosome-associated FAM110 C-terminal domain-containing protein n=1 Tax=Anopheles maculatus TaxID=74869 RepID=A0A182STL2_9DIPT